MPATTEILLTAAFRTALETMTPRVIEGQATRRWEWYEGNENGPVRSDARWYRFAWHDQGYTPGGGWGPEQVSTDSHLHVVVDYGSIPEQRVRMVATDDRYQIRDVCNRLKSTVPGLRWFEVQGWDFVNTDRNQARIEHRFLTRYMKARA